MPALLALLLALVPAAPSRAQDLRKHAAKDIGILLMAHGGDPSWDNEIDKIKKQLSKEFAVEIALGMGDSKTIQDAVNKLQSQGVKRIIGVPFFISSVSEIMDQTNFLFGLRDKPSETLMGAAHGHMGHGNMDKIKLKASFDMAPALDDSPLVSEILTQRAKALSREPKREALLLVAHGPVEDGYNEKWLEMMRVHAGRVKDALGFVAADVATLRDDAPRDVRDKAVQAMRSAVSQLSRQGHVLVVPLLIAKGGIEKKIPEELNGTFFKWSGDTLAPHPNLGKWVDQSVRKTAGLPIEPEKKEEKGKKQKKMKPVEDGAGDTPGDEGETK